MNAVVAGAVLDAVNAREAHEAELVQAEADAVAVIKGRCRGCGAAFENPYGGGVESALCDACIAKPMPVKAGVFTTSEGEKP